MTQNRRARGKLSGIDLELFGMKRQAIALTVENDGAVTVWADLMLRVKDLSPVRAHGGDRLIESAVGIEIEKRSLCGRLVLVLYETASGIAFLVRQYAYSHARSLFFMDLSTEHGGIE